MKRRWVSGRVRMKVREGGRERDSVCVCARLRARRGEILSILYELQLISLSPLNALLPGRSHKVGCSYSNETPFPPAGAVGLVVGVGWWWSPHKKRILN